MPTHMPYVSNAKTFSRYDKDGHEFADRYSRQSVFAAPGHVLYSQPPIQPPIQPPSQPPSYDGLISTALARPQRMYGSGMGPVLPPMQLKDCTALDDLTAKSYRRAPETRSEPKTVKEEKAQGGVSAHLDYEMDQMSDFVSDMAQGMYVLYFAHLRSADIDIFQVFSQTRPFLRPLESLSRSFCRLLGSRARPSCWHCITWLRE